MPSNFQSPADENFDGDRRQGSRVATSPLAWSLTGGLFITLIFYLLQAFGMRSWSAPADFFVDNWFLVSPLILGFAIQTGLFRAIHLRRHPGGGAMMATSGGMSASAMFACCLHNLVFLFPLLGATGIAAFFSTYQTEVFLASIVFVLIGITVMTRTLRSISQPGCHMAENNTWHNDSLRLPSNFQSPADENFGGDRRHRSEVPTSSVAATDPKRQP